MSTTSGFTSASSAGGWPALALLLVTLPAAAQEDPLRFRASLAAARHDNFFQAPEGELERDVDTLTGQVRMDWRLPGQRSEGDDRLYAAIQASSWSGLGDPFSVRVGFAGEHAPHGFDVFAEAILDRPTADFEDEVSVADMLRLNGEYSYRLSRAWELKGLGVLHRQTFEAVPGNDNDLYSLGAAARYRGWGSRISPEVGVATARRDAESDDESFDEDEAWIQLRSAATPRLYLSLRYRLRERDYTVSFPGARNFGRADDRDQWTLSADWRAWERISVNLYYTLEDADSTRPSRSFEAQMLSLGVTAEF